MIVRDRNIDYLRTLGILLIILAHTSIPNWLIQIRSFDVVMLCFLSGCCISYHKYIDYIKKRFKRLIIPAWIMLSILFSLTFVACIIMNRIQLYSIGKIVKSFFFLNEGIGFIWIVRIYFLIALFTPLIIGINKKIRNDIAFIILNFIWIIIGHFICQFYNNNDILYY